MRGSIATIVVEKGVDEESGLWGDGSVVEPKSLVKAWSGFNNSSSGCHQTLMGGVARFG